MEKRVFKRWVESGLNLKYLDQDVHNLLMQKLDDEQLDGSGFLFQCIVDVILAIYKIGNIQASSWVELPEKYKNKKSIINIKNDQFCILWCILAYLYPVEDHKNRTANFSMHFNKFNLKGLDLPMKAKDIPKLENLYRINVDVFELNGTVLTPIHSNENYLQPQIDLFSFANHNCPSTKLHCLVNKDSHMKHLCRR